MRSRALPLALALTGAAILGAGAVWLFLPKPQVVKRQETPLSKVTREAAQNPKKGEDKFKKFVADHVKNQDPKVQDEVGSARIQIGYYAAKRGNWQEARATFQTAEKEYKGTGIRASDFGGIPDQAAYQAAVCLVADGKKEEAKAEFRKFFKDHALSPLVHAVRKRLAKLTGGVTTPADEVLLQGALDKQTAHMKFETSVCGPRAIAYVLPLLGKPAVDYKELAKICGTNTKEGTTLEGVRKGLLAQGVHSYGYQLNRADFEKLPCPALILQNDHYLVALRVGDGKVHVYDPRFKAEADNPLPAIDDAKFTVTVLAFQPIETKS